MYMMFIVNCQMIISLVDYRTDMQSSTANALF